MKKRLFLILAAVMLLSLASCGSNPDTPSTEASTEPSGTTGGEVTTVSYPYEFEGMDPGRRCGCSCSPHPVCELCYPAGKLHFC